MSLSQRFIRFSDWSNVSGSKQPVDKLRIMTVICSKMIILTKAGSASIVEAPSLFASL